MSSDAEPERATECYISTGDEDVQKLLSDSVRSLHPHATKYLLSIGVCERCIIRLLGIPAQGSAVSSLSTLDLRRMLMVNEETSSFSACEGSDICNVCLGVLQLSYRDDKETLVKKASPYEFTSVITELVKLEGYEIDSFSLEVSVPAGLLENESALWLHLKQKYGSEAWFQERLLSESISVKDALKSLIANSLETLLGVKLSTSSFRIRLTYNEAKSKAQISAKASQGCKRRKTDVENGCKTTSHETSGTDGSDLPTSNENGSIERIPKELRDVASSNCCELSLEKAIEPCSLAFLLHRTPIYFGGRYLKYSRNVSQTRWIIDDERMGKASVEEIIGGSILPMCRGDNYKFHAAGREDIDVRMLGSGRPFLVEVQNPRQIPAQMLLKEIETKINNLEDRFIGIKNLRFVGSQGWTLMREGEAEKQKQYAALVWISRPLEDEDILSISSLKDTQILQRTPVRVLHRRSPLDREKVIHWMKIQKLCGSSQYFLLHLCTQAGTYIKEFVHGDLGRTSPSIGSILGCRAEILQLDVTDVKMDCFQPTDGN